MQAAQLLELSDYTRALCCLMRTGTMETEKGNVVFGEQKRAECREACTHEYTGIVQPLTVSFTDRQIRGKDNRGYMEKHKAAH